MKSHSIIFVHDNLEEVQVTKQFANGRVRADIAVGERVIIEIKNNLNNTSKYQRLVGQLTAYQDWKGSVFVVLCGTTEKNLLKELHQHLKALNDGSGPEERFRLFEK